MMLYVFGSTVIYHMSSGLRLACKGLTLGVNLKTPTHSGLWARGIPGLSIVVRSKTGLLQFPRRAFGRCGPKIKQKLLPQETCRDLGFDCDEF